MEKWTERPSFNEVQRYIQNCSYPCSKEELIECAREHEAPFNVIRTLEVVRTERRFDNLNDVKLGVERIL